MSEQESWSVRLDITGPTNAYETALEERCGAMALSVSRPYLDAPNWIIEAFFDHAPDDGLVAAALQQASDDNIVPDHDIIAYGKRDWLAENRASFPPLHIGRFWIYGSHVTQQAPAGTKKLQIEAAEAFGSGTHPTTEGCLIALDDLLKKDSFKRKARSVLDLGAGSAILAMAVARLMPYATIIASDIDPVATRTASANRRLNHISAKQMPCLTSKGFASRKMHHHAPYDVLIANILAGPLKALSAEIAAKLSAEGRLILSGILIAQEPLIIAAFRKEGLIVRRRIHIGEWSALVMSFAHAKGVV
ncbi:MAG: 50S ribosomal protein L11 methyltransferase [Candidatus Puniceispirillaceae bacterium]